MIPAGMVDRTRWVDSSSQACKGMGEVRDRLIRASKNSGNNVLGMTVLNHFLGQVDLELDRQVISHLFA
jgi:hypothetical protein